MTSEALPIKPHRVMAALSRVLPDDAIVVADAGTPTPYVSAYYEVHRPGRHVIIPRAYGGLGYAIPAVVGAKIARPEQLVVGLCGDGSFGMSAGELETLARLELPVVLLNFNNSCFGWIKAIQSIHMGGHYLGVDFSTIDHAAVARAFGLDGIRIERAAELEGALGGSGAIGQAHADRHPLRVGGGRPAADAPVARRGCAERGEPGLGRVRRDRHVVTGTELSMAQEYLNHIAGEWVPSATGRTFEDRDPADRDRVVGVFPSSAGDDVDRAVAAARSALPGWSALPAPRRADVVREATRLLQERKDDIARIATGEMGKILLETRGDVQEGIDTGLYMSGEGRRLFGQTTPSELPSKFAMSVRRPVGVAGIISPWNFPMAIPTWKIFPALVCGNTVVFKPSSDAPATAAALVQALLDAGVPRGVVNLVYGSGAEVGMGIATHPDVGVVSFTGSAATGRTLAEACGRSLKRLSLELGGKNGQIVMDDADLELALEGALWGAFGTTGQRCTATSRLIVHRDVAEELTARLADRARGLRVGPGLDEATEMGPLVNEAARQKVADYVRIGQEEGARLVTGGAAATGGALDRGWFFQPTIFADVRPEMRIAQEEIFGPVLSILTVGSLDEAIDVLNGTPYGLSSSLYTRDVNAAFRAIERIDAGITYINGPTIGAEVHLPFGGTKNTGNGHRESGTEVLNTFSEWKSVYVDYSGRLQRAQIDTETLA